MPEHPIEVKAPCSVSMCEGGHQSALGWQAMNADLSAYAGQGINLRIAFRTDSSGTLPGVYVEDLRVD